MECLCKYQLYKRILRPVLGLALYCSLSINLYSQDLLDLLNEEEVPVKEYISSTFKGTRLVNGHSVETIGKKQFLFMINHRFESVDKGISNLFGIDNSIVRFGFEYGLANRLNIGVGRSNYQKLYDGFVKYKIIQQATGPGGLPVSLTYFTSFAVNTEPWIDESVDFQTIHRFNYVHQFLLASKISSGISLQIMPTLLHKNLVERRTDNNKTFAIGLGGRFKVSKRVSVNPEYYYKINNEIDSQFSNALSLGIDIETGGHVFQLLFSNSRATHEKTLITETSGKWLDGDIHFGFNITRFFSTTKNRM